MAIDGEDTPGASAEGGAEQASPPRRPRSRFDRIDGAVYAVEQAIVVGALFVMTITYVLTVLRNNAVREVNTVDDLLIRLAGYADQQQAPEAVVSAITGIWTPVVVGALTFILALLALRTRSRVGLEPDTPSPPTNWPRRLSWAAVITGLLGASLIVLKAVPLTWVCVISLVALVALAAVFTLRDAEGPSWPRFFGSVGGGAAVVVYFVQTENWTHIGVGAILMIYVGFFGASMATRDGKHISVDAVRKAFKSKYLHLYNAVSWSVTALFTGFLLLMAFFALERNIASGATHQASELPLYVVIGPIVLAFALMVLRFGVHAARALRAFRRGDPPPKPAVELH